MRRSIERRRSVVAVVALSTFALIVSDSRRLLGGYWERHAIVSGLVTSLLMLALTVAVIDEVFERRDRQRWQKFVVLAYRALAQEAEDVRVRLLQYVTGKSSRLTVAADPDEDLLALARPAISGLTGLDSSDIAGRLRQLLGDADWVQATYLGIRSIKRHNWKNLFQYAPILVSHADTATVLNEFSALNESIVRLERLFEEYAQAGWEAEPRAMWRDEVCDQWIAVSRLGIALENSLHRGLTHLDWVSDEDLDALMESFGTGAGSRAATEVTSPHVSAAPPQTLR